MQVTWFSNLGAATCKSQLRNEEACLPWRKPYRTTGSDCRGQWRAYYDPEGEPQPRNRKPPDENAKGYLHSRDALPGSKPRRRTVQPGCKARADALPPAPECRR